MRNIQTTIPFMTDLDHTVLPVVNESTKEFGPLHIKLCEGIEFSSRYQLPLVNAVEDFIPERMTTYHRIKKLHNKNLKGSCVHFFMDDSYIEPLWSRPQLYAEVLSKYNFVLSPDFSVYMDMLNIQKWWNDFRNKLLAAYFQKYGVNIIPAPSWANMEDIDRYAEGWPIKSLIAINSTGVGYDKRSIHNWLDGYFAMTDILKPTHILRYGGLIEGEYQEISTYYDNNNKKGAHYGRKRIILS